MVVPTTVHPAAGSGDGSGVAGADGAIQGIDLTLQLQRTLYSLRRYTEAEVLRPHGLTWAAFVILHHLQESVTLEVRQIAAASGLAKGTVSGVLRTLESSQFVARERSDDDRRLVFVTLTEVGRRLVRRLDPLVELAQNGVYLQASVEERMQLRRSLGTLSIAAHRMDRGLPSCSTTNLP